MKPLGGKSYGHIPHLPGSRMGPADHHCHEGQARICTERARDKHDRIIVQEKLDGSNVGVYRKGDELFALVRSGYLASTSPHEQHHRFAAWVDDNKDRFMAVLETGERMCGEWLMMAHGTRYELPHEPFVAFDIMTGPKRRTWQDFAGRAVKGEFEIPRYLASGPTSLAEAMRLLKAWGRPALDEPEGVVYRVERKGEVDFLAKYVRPDKVDGKYFGDTPVWNTWRMR